MPTDKVDEFLSQAETQHFVFAAVILPLARMIYAGQVNPETLTKEGFCEVLSNLGKSHEDAFEVVVTRVEKEMRLVEHCVDEGEAKSGVVLLFTLIEGEINGLIRSLLRIRGFSPGAITDALRGIDFDTKVNVLLPLLDVAVPERLRNAALQCKTVRNLVVHNKASPALMADVGDKPSDAEVAAERAAKFFQENPVERLRADIEEFSEAGLSENESVQWGRYLFERFFVRGEV